MDQRTQSSITPAIDGIAGYRLGHQVPPARRILVHWNQVSSALRDFYAQNDYMRTDLEYEEAPDEWPE